MNRAFRVLLLAILLPLRAYGGDSLPAKENSAKGDSVAVVPAPKVQPDTKNAQVSAPSIAGSWSGVGHGLLPSFSLLVDLKQTDDIVTGSGTMVTPQGASKRYVWGRYDQKEGAFICKDIGFDSSVAAGELKHCLVDEYKIHLDNDDRLIGTYKSSSCNDVGSFMLDRKIPGQTPSTSPVPGEVSRGPGGVSAPVPVAPQAPICHDFHWASGAPNCFTQSSHGLTFRAIFANGILLAIARNGVGKYDKICVCVMNRSRRSVDVLPQNISFGASSPIDVRALGSGFNVAQVVSILAARPIFAVTDSQNNTSTVSAYRGGLLTSTLGFMATQAANASARHAAEERRELSKDILEATTIPPQNQIIGNLVFKVSKGAGVHDLKVTLDGDTFLVPL
jgi:hypothetical protein